MKKSSSTLIKSLFYILILAFVLGCGGGGGGGDPVGTDPGTDPDPQTNTTISGKVSLSSSIGGKAVTPAQKMAGYASIPRGRTSHKTFMKTRATQVPENSLPYFKAGDVVTNATVWLYDSDHPEWIYPIAEGPTDSAGNYSLSELANDDKNLDANGDKVYTNGDPIPAGNYTLLAFTPGGFDPVTGSTTEPVVAIQTIVNNFDGTVSGADLIAQKSTVAPKVEAMFGQSKNTDGTQTWGSDSLELPSNAAIQVNFSMAMARGSISNGISISPAVAGEWTISADWLSATFYPTSGSLTEGESYVVTINGADTSTSTVSNVYGNPLAKTATGRFMVRAGADASDTVSPSAQVASPESQTGVDIITPIRIESNEILDVNNLLLESSPSLGAKPGVLYVGENDGTDQFKYVYEFLLAEPLATGETYSLTVSGGTDMAGNAMNSLTYSFSTKAASDITGITDGADTATQDTQGDVIDVFGRWVRAFNDHNLTQLQSLMVSDFVFEYDIAANGVDDKDLNRDGRYDLVEFSDMIDEAFTFWEYCGTTITGEVIGDVNLTAVLDGADFEFKLGATSDNTQQECQDSAPQDSLYATLTNNNGVWLITRVSEGVDTRDQVLDAHGVVNTRLQEAGNASFTDDGATLAATPSRDASGMVSNGYTFSWDPVTDASSYVFIIFNAREDWRGRAYVMPATTTEWAMPLDVDQNGSGIIPAGSIKSHDLFGFSDTAADGKRPGVGFTDSGEEFNWTVLAMGTKTVNDFDQGRVNNPFDDIIASSTLKRYQNPGDLNIMSVAVSDNSTPLVFDEFINGFDAGNLDQVTLDIVSPNLDAGNCCAAVNVNGVISNYYPITFDASGNASVVIDLGQGFNWVDVNDGVGEYQSFSVQTTGGTPAAIQLSNIMADTNTGGMVSYTPDEWNFFDTSDNGGATSITFTATVTDPAVTSLNVNVSTDTGAYEYFSVDVTSGSVDITLDVYTGNNWIGIDTYYCGDPNDYTTCESHYTNLGVYSSEGSVYVPPVGDVLVTEAVQTDDWGSGSYWDASNDADNEVVVTAVLANPNDTVYYNISSDGNWENGTLTVNPDGSFALPVTLYNGDNWVNLYEENGGYWYDVNIYTANGNQVIRPVVDSINGVAYDGSGSVMVDGCSATINGQALAEGNVNIDWSGDDGSGNYNYENYNLLAGVDNGSGLGDFSVTVPVVSGTNAYNSVSINDANYIGIYLDLRTSATDCVYVPPVMTVDTISNGLDTAALISDPGNPDYVGVDGGGFVTSYDALDAAGVTINGTSSQADKPIKLDVYNCNNQSYSVTADSMGDWSAMLNLYDGYNSINISDGVNYRYMDVISNNGVSAVPDLTATADGLVADYSDCGYASFDAGTATTATISGSTTGPDGTGTYWDSLGTMHTFDIVGGVFSFIVDLYDGYNSFSINDVDYNYTSIDLFTTNSVQKPKLLTITSPMHGDTVDGSVTPVDVTVTAMVETDPLVNVSGYNPNIFYAYADYTDVAGNYVSYSYVSDPLQAFNGELPITVNTDGTVNFVVPVATDQPVYINIYGYSDTGESHGHTIYLNNIYGYGDSSYKPGAQHSRLSPREITSQQRAAKNLMKKLRNR